MAENTIWKVYFFADNKNTQPNRIHGLDPWIQIGSRCGPYLGQSPTHLQPEADLPANMQGGGSLSDEPICALMDSVTSTYSIARVDSLGGDEDG